jgi:hypothetical protein
VLDDELLQVTVDNHTQHWLTANETLDTVDAGRPDTPKVDEKRTHKVEQRRDRPKGPCQSMLRRHDVSKGDSGSRNVGERGQQRTTLGLYVVDGDWRILELQIYCACCQDSSHPGFTIYSKSTNPMIRYTTDS